MAKTRAWKQTRATAARRRKAAKAAHRRNRGSWSGYDGQQKHCAMKAAFKAFLLETQEVPQMGQEWAKSIFSVSTAKWHSERAKSDAETKASQPNFTAWSNRKGLAA